MLDKSQGMDLILIEVEKLRDEINQRLNHQVQILSILISGSVGLFGITFGYKIYTLLLLIPIFAIGCGLMYVSCQFAIMRMGQYIYKMEEKFHAEEDGWEHFLQCKLREPRQFLSGNFYPFAATLILISPILIPWLLFFLCVGLHKLHLSCFWFSLVIAYFVISMLLTVFIIKGLRLTLWEYQSD